VLGCCRRSGGRSGPANRRTWTSLEAPLAPWPHSRTGCRRECRRVVVLEREVLQRDHAAAGRLARPRKEKLRQLLQEEELARGGCQRGCSRFLPNSSIHQEHGARKRLWPRCTSLIVAGFVCALRGFAQRPAWDGAGQLGPPAPANPPRSRGAGSTLTATGSIAATVVARRMTPFVGIDELPPTRDARSGAADARRSVAAVAQFHQAGPYESGRGNRAKEDLPHPYGPVKSTRAASPGRPIRGRR